MIKINDLNLLKEQFEKKGIKLFLIRLKIYEYLIKYKIYFIVEEVYNSFLKEILIFFKILVYNILNFFVEKGFV